MEFATMKLFAAVLVTVMLASVAVSAQDFENTFELRKPTQELSLHVKVLTSPDHAGSKHTKLPSLAGIETCEHGAAVPGFVLGSHKTFINTPAQKLAHIQHRIFSCAIYILLSVFMAELPSTFRAMAIFFVVAMYTATVTAQDLAMAPAPAMDRGAASSLGRSGAVFCSTLLLSLLALLRH
ncbi:hypothetical protein DKX38_024824 [Salix brachista]|uniref:PGG domain-containing protein n=1 Tax=Salix brachista TaxID=2182728 RepID=A0A5N5JTP6_9ROSI|nr:hypothetical protein DKX38_024824 [Salix brachista]